MIRINKRKAALFGVLLVKSCLELKLMELENGRRKNNK